MRVSISVASAASCVLLPLAPARADPAQILDVGVIGSASVGRGSMAGVGLEATLSSVGDTAGYGLYVQAETGGPAGGNASALWDQKRYAAGGMLLFGWVGVELGGMYRTAPMTAPTPGVQLGLFASAGVVSIELRAGLASAGRGDHPAYGSDIGLVLAAKLPVQVGGESLAIKKLSLLPCVWWCHARR